MTKLHEPMSPESSIIIQNLVSQLSMNMRGKEAPDVFDEDLSEDEKMFDCEKDSDEFAAGAEKDAIVGESNCAQYQL